MVTGILKGFETKNVSSICREVLTTHLMSFYYWSTSNFEITPVLVSQLEAYYKVDRLTDYRENTSVKDRYFHFVAHCC